MRYVPPDRMMWGWATILSLHGLGVLIQSIVDLEMIPHVFVTVLFLLFIACFYFYLVNSCLSCVHIRSISIIIYGIEYSVLNIQSYSFIHSYLHVQFIEIGGSRCMTAQY